MTTNLLEGPTSGRLTTPNVGKVTEQQEHSFMAGGNAKWHSYFGR
jgi:hypothetical protein